MDKLVHLVLMEYLDYLVSMVPLATLDHVALRVIPDLLDILDLWEHLVHL